MPSVTVLAPPEEFCPIKEKVPSTSVVLIFEITTVPDPEAGFAEYASAAVVPPEYDAEAPLAKFDKSYVPAAVPPIRNITIDLIPTEPDMTSVPLLITAEESVVPSHAAPSTLAVMYFVAAGGFVVELLHAPIMSETAMNAATIVFMFSLGKRLELWLKNLRQFLLKFEIKLSIRYNLFYVNGVGEFQSKSANHLGTI